MVIRMTKLSDRMIRNYHERKLSCDKKHISRSEARQKVGIYEEKYMKAPIKNDLYTKLHTKLKEIEERKI